MVKSTKKKRLVSKSWSPKQASRHLSPRSDFCGVCVTVGISHHVWTLLPPSGHKTRNKTTKHLQKPFSGLRLKLYQVKRLHYSLNMHQSIASFHAKASKSQICIVHLQTDSFQHWSHWLICTISAARRLSWFSLNTDGSHLLQAL